MKPGPPCRDLSGRVFGRLTVVSSAPHRPGKRGGRWNCVCSCGKKTEVGAGDLGRRRGTRSCGCLWTEMGKIATLRHGDARVNRLAPEWSTWRGMWQRCTNKNQKFYRHYGGRGVSVCERWKSYENFLADMGRKPSLELTLDRIDNDGDYELDNCRWTTRSEQIKNQRPRRRVNGRFAPGGP